MRSATSRHLRKSRRFRIVGDFLETMAAAPSALGLYLLFLWIRHCEVTELGTSISRPPALGQTDV